MNKMLTVIKNKINLRWKKELFREKNILFDKIDEIDEKKIKINEINISLFSNILFSPLIKKKSIDNITIERSAMNLLNIIDTGSNKTK